METITVTENHLKLLQRLYIESNNDYAYLPVPGANPKRPYNKLIAAFEELRGESK